MKRLIKQKVLYRCSVCKTDYTNKHNAQKCEKRTLEIKAFIKGDRVSNTELRMCGVRNMNYTFKGVVTKVVGPIASDYEYEVKWLGGIAERLKSHVFQYQVKFKCPHCKKIKEDQYFAPELIKLGNKNRSRSNTL